MTWLSEIIAQKVLEAKKARRSLEAEIKELNAITQSALDTLCQLHPSRRNDEQRAEQTALLQSAKEAIEGKCREIKYIDTMLAINDKAQKAAPFTQVTLPTR